MKKPSVLRSLVWAGVPALGMVAALVGLSLYHRYSAPVMSFPHATIQIQHADGSAPLAYTVEVATTPQQQAYGLMFRQSLAPNTGMLFVWDNDQVIRMWMKNTYIPLDMLFVRHDGIIEKITTHAVPFDLTTLSSDEPVRGVIEIGGDEAVRQHIKTGDKVLFPAFSGRL